MKYFVTGVIIVLAAAAIWVVFFSGILASKKTPNSNDLAQNDSVADKLDRAEGPVVVLETNFGPIRIALRPEEAPKTTANFTKLAQANFYNKLTFHRVVPNFVIQGGDPKGDGTGGPGYTIPAEIKLLHKRGAVAMARLPDAVNPSKASSGSQFYIALQDLPGLDGEYTVFGEVIEGMESVERIARVQTDPNDRPVEPVVINKATLIAEPVF